MHCYCDPDLAYVCINHTDETTPERIAAAADLKELAETRAALALAALHPVQFEQLVVREMAAIRKETRRG